MRYASSRYEVIMNETNQTMDKYKSAAPARMCINAKCMRRCTKESKR